MEKHPDTEMSKESILTKMRALPEVESLATGTYQILYHQAVKNKREISADWIKSVLESHELNYEIFAAAVKGSLVTSLCSSQRSREMVLLLNALFAFGYQLQTHELDEEELQKFNISLIPIIDWIEYFLDFTFFDYLDEVVSDTTGQQFWLSWTNSLIDDANALNKHPEKLPDDLKWWLRQLASEKECSVSESKWIVLNNRLNRILCSQRNRARLIPLLSEACSNRDLLCALGNSPSLFEDDVTYIELLLSWEQAKAEATGLYALLMQGQRGVLYLEAALKKLREEYTHDDFDSKVARWFRALTNKDLIPATSPLLRLLIKEAVEQHEPSVIEQQLARNRVDCYFFVVKTAMAHEFDRSDPEKAQKLRAEIIEDLLGRNNPGKLFQALVQDSELSWLVEAVVDYSAGGQGNDSAELFFDLAFSLDTGAAQFSAGEDADNKPASGDEIFSKKCLPGFVALLREIARHLNNRDGLDKVAIIYYKIILMLYLKHNRHIHAFKSFPALGHVIPMHYRELLSWEPGEGDIKAFKKWEAHHSHRFNAASEYLNELDRNSAVLTNLEYRQGENRPYWHLDRENPEMAKQGMALEPPANPAATEAAQSAQEDTEQLAGAEGRPSPSSGKTAGENALFGNNTGITLDGISARRLHSRILELVRLFLGLEFLLWLFNGSIKLLGMKRKGKLAISSELMTYSGETQFMGKVIRSRDYEFTMKSIASIKKLSSLKSLYLILGLLVLISTSFFGVSVLFDGIDLGDHLIILFGAGCILAGLLIDAFCYSLFSRNRKRISILLYFTGNEPPLRFQVDSSQADTFLDFYRAGRTN